MSRHRATAPGPSVLGDVARGVALGLVLVILGAGAVVASTDTGPLVQPITLTPAVTCDPLVTTYADGSTWHSCASTPTSTPPTPGVRVLT